MLGDRLDHNTWVVVTQRFWQEANALLTLNNLGRVSQRASWVRMWENQKQTMQHPTINRSWVLLLSLRLKGPGTQRDRGRGRHSHACTHTEGVCGKGCGGCGLCSWTQQPGVVLRRENQYLNEAALLFSPNPARPRGRELDWDSSYTLASQSAEQGGWMGRADLERPRKGSSVGGSVPQTGNKC